MQEVFGIWACCGEGVGGVQTADHFGTSAESVREGPVGGGRGGGVVKAGRPVVKGGHHQGGPFAHHGKEGVDDGVGAACNRADF